MRSRSIPSTLSSSAIAAALTAALATTATAQLGERAIPGTYAITGARIVPVSGPIIERGTIVIRDGLIAAVGATVAAPADARIVEGAGLTIYPGLIDGLSNVGVPAARQQGGGGFGGLFLAQQSGPQQPPAPSAPNSQHPLGLQPELRIIDVVKFEGDALDGVRGAGITTALASPRDGIFMGQSALINLAGGTAQDMLVRSPVALHVGFTPLRAGGYPNSLMGVFASLRQMLLDAQRYRDLQAAYARNPRGMRRPEADASLAALVPALSKEMPVIMMANSQREIERALDLATEFGLRVYIAGGEEAWMIADRLKKDNVPVIATLNFPRRSANTTDDADPEPVRVLQSRVDIPRNPGKLAGAGVRLAFTSGGMGSMADFLTNVRKAVEDGMPRDQAIRALTLTPAELYGVSDRLGSIEAGKIANLTVVRGDLLDRAGRVTQVFIDGRPIAVRAPAADNGSANAASGTWTVTATFAEGDRTVTLSLTQEGERLRGTMQGALGTGEIGNGSLGANGDLRFTATVTLGGTSEEATFTGTLTGNVMRGSIQIVGHPNGTFVGTRPDAGGRGAGRPQGQRPPQ
ncbi:MAG TPA: amidohydrolase family protein [Gemmatimonadaceae bacterium]|nr:amidohydrolase family protein [Gemmatimonadaceae bacterium]